MVFLVLTWRKVRLKP